MEMEDGPIYSARTVCDYNINENMVQQPDMPEPGLFKQLWYGIGRVEALYQINHTATARAVKQGTYNTVVFVPKITKEFKSDKHARILARDHVQQNLKRLGFSTEIDKYHDENGAPNINVYVPLNTMRNACRMRIFGPYMMFDKQYVLTPDALTSKIMRTR